MNNNLCTSCFGGGLKMTGTNYILNYCNFIENKASHGGAIAIVDSAYS